MNAEQLERSADLLLENVKGWEQRTIEVICERIKTLGYISPTDQKALKNIVDFTGDMYGITKDLATTLAMTSKEVEELYKQTLEYTGNQKESLYNYVGIPHIPFEENKKAQSIVSAYMRTTNNAMRNLSMTKALYLTGADGIRKPFEDAYKSILDKAVLAVSTGAGDFQSEMRSTIAQLGGGGVRVNYGSGVTRRLDTVVRQNILYGAKQASIEYDEVIGEELGCDGFEVDYHSSPRPSHGFMGGQMFANGPARTIKDVYYPSGAVALERLNDYGCLHDKSTVILGISEPSYTKEELAEFKAQDEELVDIDGVKKTRYEWKQEQRKLETAVRYKKDQANAFKAVGDMDGRRQAQGSIDNLTAKYDRLTEKAGLQSTPERMSVAGFSKVKATTKKSTAVVKKSLITGNNSGIMKKTDKPVKVGGVDCNIKNDKFSFSTGSDGKTSAPREAVIYELPDNTKFIFPKGYDKTKQTMTPDDAIRLWYKVPENIRGNAQKVIQFVDYYNPVDVHWRKKYKNFTRSYATGGDTITFYRYEDQHDFDYVVRAYCHEAGHYIDIINGVGSTRYSSAGTWTNAMIEDEILSGNSSVTEYGKNAKTEDFAESIAEYVRNPKKFNAQYPNRTKLIEQILK